MVIDAVQVVVIDARHGGSLRADGVHCNVTANDMPLSASRNEHHVALDSLPLMRTIPE
jgi:hypothetical protein